MATEMAEMRTRMGHLEEHRDAITTVVQEQGAVDGDPGKRRRRWRSVVLPKPKTGQGLCRSASAGYRLRSALLRSLFVHPIVAQTSVPVAPGCSVALLKCFAAVWSDFDMERTPAACAMEWGIQLDKGLRSNNPAKRKEAIQEVGARLEWWSKEPELSMAEYDMFGLVPGEDKLFANAIFLRLADTFVSGDKHTKLCVVKIFMSELKHRKTKSSDRKNTDFFSKYKVPNHLELLKRIKLCFNSGDEEVRAMSLVLFGCWSDFAKDNAEIRYLILSCIVSCHVLEVKASLFAAGCFCEFSDDFACVFLEMLVRVVSSSDMPIAGRLAGIRAFAKLGRSSALSSRAYEEGTKLILGLVEDDIVTSMLISLSIIASRSAFLISRQVDLLLRYLNQDRSLSLRATSLRCLNIVLSRSRFRFSPPAKLMSAMFNMLNGELPPVMQHDAIHIMYEVSIVLKSLIMSTHMLLGVSFNPLLVNGLV
ncbi:hypothetical protein E3N88_40365 [Mikania micrantha]|uniref:Integrator complex subunit 7 N-terminal domain-containing protein n=1 Tax=Mikania micrantha TaxID=192012 RepID=A0A5N6LPR0_9ASTR|nr:hypothetical protein E3N88_40365 [Mikania micrantha]